MPACGAGSYRRTYVAANERIFNGLPRYPGSKLKSRTSAPYTSEDGRKILGYGTRFDFTLPPQAFSSRVTAFFQRRLEPKWLLVETLGGPVLNFRRGKETVSINLESARGHVLEIAVDHAYYGKLGRCGVPGGCGGSAAWAAMRRAVLACRAKSVSQTHRLRVTVTLADGRTLAGQEPRIDAIVDVLNAARCRVPPAFSTE